MHFIRWVALACALCATQAVADELQPIAQKTATSLLKQAPKVSAVKMAPFSGDPDLSWRFADALAQALKGPVQIRPDAQTLVTGEIVGGKAAVRLVSVANGTVLASENAQLPVAKSVESASVEVAMRKIADQLVDGFSKMPGNARYRRLAVLPLTETGDEARKRELGAVVTAELSTSLRRDHGLLLVERAKLQQVMGEIKLGQSGAVDSATAPEIGKLSDAQALVMGSVAQAGDRYLIDARIVATETAETLASASEAVQASTLVSFSSDAVVLRSRKDAMFRSLLIPGWGQIYNRESVKGYLFMGGVAAAVGTAIALHQMGASSENQYKTASITAGQAPADFQAQVAALRQKAQDRYAQRNVAIAVGGGLWMLNLLDAYFSGVDGDRLLSRKF